jgi:hypothetical protein
MGAAAKQDKNALSVSEEVMVERSVAKASPQYSNVSWDVVDAVNEGRVKIEDIDEKDLPEEMKSMSKKERIQYVEKMKRKREEIQKKIKQLKKERDEYVSQKRKQLSMEQTLDEALLNAVKEQAVKKKYKFEKK